MTTPSRQIETIEFSFERWQEGFLRTILYVTSGIGFLAVLGYVLTSQNPSFNAAAIGFYLLFLLLTFLRIPHQVRGTIFTIILLGISIWTLFDTGINGSALVFFLGSIAISSLIISPSAGFQALILSIAFIAAAAWLVLTNRHTLPSPDAVPGDLAAWIQNSIYLILMSVVVVLAVRILRREFLRAQDQADTTFTALREERAGLEDRVAERTAELSERSLALQQASSINERRVAQFQAIAEVTRAITSLENPATLLPRIAQTISDQLGFYHVGIFLSDESREYGILSATNSEGGQRMLARGHRLKIGEVGIVGNVLQSGKPRIALDTGGDPFFFDNPDLPNTRSEMALPLRSGDQVIGALDVQSTDANAFSSDDIDILTILADEVSVTIQNSRLFESTRRSLVEAETIYRMYSDKAWARLLSETDIAGYQYTVTGIKSIDVPNIPPEIQQTIDKGETYKKINTKQNTSELAVPIRLRGDTIGLFKILVNGQDSWDEEQVDLVKSVSDRLALALENARLFEETSNRASRERTVSEITSKIRSTTNSQEMLQTAISELKQILNANEILILPYKQTQTSDYEAEQIPPPDPV